MAPIASVTGKNATLDVYPDCVVYKKFSRSREAVAPYSRILRVDFRQMGRRDTGFIKIRAPRANFDFVTHRLLRSETPDCPRAQALKFAYDTIRQNWQTPPAPPSQT